MTPRYPGARWIPTGAAQSGYNSHRCHTWHEAVTTAGVDGIAGWNSSAHACHGFTAKDGDAGQYVDFDQWVYGTLNGNSYAITWETWDDLLPATNRSPDDSHGPNDFSWTGQQVERNADIAAWEVDALGIPLHFMAHTREAGHAPHRLGVPSAGGDVDVGYGPDCWTAHRGKECPGDRRILQLRDKVLPRAAVILAAVQAGRCGFLPPGPVDLSAALARTGSTPPYDPDGWLTVGNAEQNILDRFNTVLTDVVNRLYTLEDHTSRAASAQVSNDRFNDVLTDVVNRLYLIQAALNAASPPPVVTPAATYTVAKGDTLHNIANRLGVSMAALQQANAITDPNVIAVGQVLTVTV